FLTGRLEKYAELDFVSGNVYRGEISNELKGGVGVQYFASGSRVNLLIAQALGTGPRYSGEFNNNLASGYGVYRRASGSYQKGQFENQQLNGLGAEFDMSGAPTAWGVFDHDTLKTALPH